MPSKILCCALNGGNPVKAADRKSLILKIVISLFPISPSCYVLSKFILL